MEDLIVKDDAVRGVAVSPSTILRTGLRLDCLCMGCRAVLDATGRSAHLVNVLRAKLQGFQPGGAGGGFVDVETAQEGILERTGEAYAGLYVAGVAVCAAYGLPGMGSIMGSVLQSGRMAADMIAADLNE